MTSRSHKFDEVVKSNNYDEDGKYLIKMDRVVHRSFVC